MSQMNEHTAEKLETAQAIELARVLDLQARWENMREDRGQAGDGFTIPALQGRQKAYDAFQIRLAAYSSKYRSAQVPEPTLNTPERVGMWCRAVRGVLRRAAEGHPGEYLSHVVAKAYRLVERIAARIQKDPPQHGSASENTGAAILHLDLVIDWCDALVGPLSPATSSTPTPLMEVSAHKHEDAA
jgi:hypothetical protein